MILCHEMFRRIGARRDRQSTLDYFSSLSIVPISYDFTDEISQDATNKGCEIVLCFVIIKFWAFLLFLFSGLRR